MKSRFTLLVTLDTLGKLICREVRGDLRRECLDHVLLLGERHLRSVLAEYARHYNQPPSAPGPAAGTPQRQSGRVVDITARIERSHVLGGLISEYRRAV